jgi:hypothetical protein
LAPHQMIAWHLAFGEAVDVNRSSSRLKRRGVRDAICGRGRVVRGDFGISTLRHLRVCVMDHSAADAAPGRVWSWNAGIAGVTAGCHWRPLQAIAAAMTPASSITSCICGRTSYAPGTAPRYNRGAVCEGRAHGQGIMRVRGGV